MMKLTPDFYLLPDVVQVAQNLLGKMLITRFNGQLTSGMITETEAYAGITDKASHAYNNRNTPRTQVMYEKGGIAYVYLCYGIHHLFNVVTHEKGVPHAVLIRAIEPIEGIDIMLQRRKKLKQDYTLCTGPGTVAAALGIRTQHTGLSLQSDEVYIEDRGIIVHSNQIIASPRIGVGYAQEDALLLYRFRIRNNKWVGK